jgi:ketosteroid isomerase-like protein
VQNKRASAVAIQIADLNNTWNQASLRMDVAALDSLYSDDCIFHFQNGQAADKKWVMHLLSSGSVAFESIRNDNVRIRVYERAALWTSRTSVTEVYNDQRTQGEYLWLRVWSHAKDGWKIVAFQSTTSPSSS